MIQKNQVSSLANFGNKRRGNLASSRGNSPDKFGKEPKSAFLVNKKKSTFAETIGQKYLKDDQRMLRGYTIREFVNAVRGAEKERDSKQ